MYMYTSTLTQVGLRYKHTRQAGGQAGTHPVSGAEVDGLGEVVALVEAGVVAAREGDDKLARVLIGAHNLSTAGARDIIE